MQALILAGGKGTRLRPLTMHTPKPIVPIANRPFLLYQLELLKQADVRDVILSLSYQPQKIEDRLGDGTDYGVRISYTVEASPLGTAGAYRNAAGLISKTTVVLNGDVLTDIDLNDVIRSHRERQAAATIVLTPVPNPTAYGLVETDGEGRVSRFLEKPKPDEVTCDTINAGIYILEPRVLDYIPEGEPFMFEYGVFPQLLERGEPFYAYTWRGYWRDIGTSASYRQANMDVLAGLVRLLDAAPLRRGEKFDETAEIDSASIVDPTCTLKAGAQVINSVISRNCFIEERARIEDSVVRGGSRIGAGAVLQGAVVGKSCHIGRAVTVGSGTALGDKSVITDYSQI
ncbi:MAG TPA: NDP-sugar synthase [Blastocatellia bacterium]|jgi:NDP-sugar pyrophosphorylase family protein|nr:NDP-sugar synthase [Blastocatellia bacterium]